MTEESLWKHPARPRSHVGNNNKTLREPARCTQPPLARSLLLVFLTANQTDCDEKNRVFQPPVIEDGLIYTHPLDGTVDLPLGSKALFVFSHQVDAGALTQDCTGAPEAPVGAFCYSPRRVDGYCAGYGGDQRRLRASAAPGAVNLPETARLLSFRTQQADPAPRVIDINQEDSLIFVEGTGIAPPWKAPSSVRRDCRNISSWKSAMQSVWPT